MAPKKKAEGSRKSPRKGKGKGKATEQQGQQQQQEQQPQQQQDSSPSDDDQHVTLTITGDVNHEQELPGAESEASRVSTESRGRGRARTKKTPRLSRQEHFTEEQSTLAEDEEMGILKVILDFYEAHPKHYDLSHALYKDEKRKERELEDVATTLGTSWTVSKISARFKSFRTDYVKLKKKVKAQQAKSGASPKRLTRLQQFKLSRGRYLDAFCRQSATAQEMGPTTETQECSDSDAESHLSPQEEADDSLLEASVDRPGAKPVSTSRSRSGSGSTHSLSSKGSKRSKVEKSKGVVGLLETIYTETTSAQKDMMKKMATMEKGRDDVRETWASYLSSITYRVPEELFASWQQETFNLSLRYTSRVPLSAALGAPPVALGVAPAPAPAAQQPTFQQPAPFFYPSQHPQFPAHTQPLMMPPLQMPSHQMHSFQPSFQPSQQSSQSQSQPSQQSDPSQQSQTFLSLLSDLQPMSAQAPANVTLSELRPSAALNPLWSAAQATGILPAPRYSPQCSTPTATVATSATTTSPGFNSSSLHISQLSGLSAMSGMSALLQTQAQTASTSPSHSQSLSQAGSDSD